MCSKHACWVRLKIKSSSHGGAACTHCFGEEVLEWRCQTVTSLTEQFYLRLCSKLPSAPGTMEMLSWHLSSLHDKSLCCHVHYQSSLCVGKKRYKICSVVAVLGFIHSSSCSCGPLNSLPTETLPRAAGRHRGELPAREAAGVAAQLNHSPGAFGCLGLKRREDRQGESKHLHLWQQRPVKLAVAPASCHPGAQRRLQTCSCRP